MIIFIWVKLIELNWKWIVWSKLHFHEGKENKRMCCMKRKVGWLVWRENEKETKFDCWWLKRDRTGGDPLKFPVRTLWMHSKFITSHLFLLLHFFRCHLSPLLPSNSKYFFIYIPVKDLPMLIHVNKSILSKRVFLEVRWE